MAKRKAKATQPARTQPTQASGDSTHRTFYLVLVVIALLALVAIFVSMSNDEDQLTAWATIKSRELHNFMQQCRDSGGTADVRPNQAPEIVFVCTYPDRTVEYTLQPGK